MSKKERLPQFVSPAGVGKYLWLTKADTKFDASGDGHYKATLTLPKTETETLNRIREAAEQFHAEFVKQAKEDEKTAKDGKAKKKAKERQAFGVFVPIKPEVDQEGNDTDNVELTFKSKAVIRQVGKEPWMKTIALFDAKRQPLPKGVNVGSGSTIKVRYEIYPVSVDSAGIAGAGLRFDAVQVIDLKQYNGGSDASGFGEEEGYVSEKRDGFEPEGGEGNPEASEGAEGNEGNGGDF